MTRSTTPLRALALAGLVAVAACDDDDMMAPPETAMFEVTIENVSDTHAFPASGVFDTPVGAGDAGPALPGSAFEFEFSAPPGAHLSFATMFAQSNDFFYGPDGEGIALWNADGTQVEGDVTGQIALWDAGTELNQEPGVGPDQAPRQGAADTGAEDPDATVRIAPDAFGNLPAVDDVIQVTLTSTGPTSWRARIENVSTATTLMASDGETHPIPLSPGVYVVHMDDDPLFTVGEADRGEGLEGIAEDGAAADLGAVVSDATGLNGLLSPGVWAVHEMPAVLFSDGQPDRGEGLEAIAEDGAAATLGANLQSDADVIASGVFSTPDGASSPGPLLPGTRYTFTFTAEEGDYLSLATMYAQSNDLFFAPDEAGIALFPGGTAVSGDVTGMILLWDAGTEVNERPGFGLFQAPRQDGPDSGPDENGAVREATDFDYGAVEDWIRVTITPVG